MTDPITVHDSLTENQMTLFKETVHFYISALGEVTALINFWVKFSNLPPAEQAEEYSKVISLFAAKNLLRLASDLGPNIAEYASAHVADTEKMIEENP